MTEPIETLTPAGIAIRFTERPYRTYEIMVPDMEMAWRKVPSPTGILSILDKPALKWWGMTTGIDGVVELIERYNWRNDGIPEKLTTDRVVELLKREQLTIYSASKKAATRGIAAHTALERLMREGEVPDPRLFPPVDRGYVKALKDWHWDNQPEIVLSEVMVASNEHGFAGRFDLLARIHGQMTLVDLKTTSKAPPRIYDEALLQLAAYALACEESGYPAPDKKIVVCVAPDGSYAVKESLCQPEHFLSVLAAHWAMNEVKALHEAKVAA